MVRSAMALLAAAMLAGAVAWVAEGVAAQPTGGRVRPPGSRPPTTATTTSRPAPDPNATEKGPWTDANVGTRVQSQLDGNMVRTQEVVGADESTVTVRTTLNVEGVKPPELDYPRRHTPEEARKHLAGLGRKVGEETIQIGDESVRCTVYERTMTMGNRKATNKTWLCTDVPGWIVRQDSDASGQNRTIFRVVEYRK